MREGKGVGIRLSCSKAAAAMTSRVFVCSGHHKSSSMSEGANLFNVGEKKEGEEGGKKIVTGQC